jgi:ATP-dependent Clp protease ATP-binding subunit ClpC
MFNFDIKKAAVWQGIKWSESPTFRFAGLLKKLYFIFFVIFFSLFLYSFLFSPSIPRERVFLGLAVIFLTFSFISWLQHAFLNSKLKNLSSKKLLGLAVSAPEEHNLAEFLDFESGKAAAKAIRFAELKKLPQVNSSHLLYFLLSVSRELSFVFSRALLDLEEIKRELKDSFGSAEKKKQRSGQVVFAGDFQNSIFDSLKIALKKGKNLAGPEELLLALARHNPIFKKALLQADLNLEDIENLVWWLDYLKEKIKERERWWDYKNLIRRGTLAKSWQAGYTPLLDQFSTDLSDLMKKAGFPETIGHQQEIAALERILASREINNALLVGEQGSGRKSIIQGLAARFGLGESLPSLNYKRVVALEIPGILAQASGKEEVQMILDKIFQEAVRAGNIILAVNDFHNFLRTEDQPGIVDISGIISQYLSLPQFQIIAITTYAGLHKYIEQRPAILGLFEKVEVSEISSKEALIYLERLALGREQEYKKFVSYPALKKIIFYADRYFQESPFPKKAVGLFDEVMVFAAASKDKVILPGHVERVVSEKIQIPVGQMELKEKEILLKMEELFHQRIIDQQEAVAEVSAALRRARAEVTVRSGPMGAFLFLGPTGVGKTETSKALAEIYFGSERRMIRLDMSEFQSLSDIARLIGSPGQEGLLTTKVRENPFSLVLLDEIEKAHPNILNLFLQVLDEGFVTDGLGRKIDFRSCIIIATSNAGYQIILKALKEKTLWSEVKQKLLNYLFEKAIFRPEFINRFDAVVVFRPLSRENLLDIAELMLQKLKKNLKEKGIEFIITLPLKEKIADLGYDPAFGAREMRRVIQDRVENALASALLSGRLKRGDRVEVDHQDFVLKISRS